MSLDVTYCSFANAYKTRALIEMETLSPVWPGRWSQCGLGISTFFGSISMEKAPLYPINFLPGVPMVNHPY
jgi:hypothetical protein